jgi:hypothetical protein
VPGCRYHVCLNDRREPVGTGGRSTGYVGYIGWAVWVV